MSQTRGKVFITGATGDIGSQTIQILQETDVHFRVMCRRQAQADNFHRRGIRDTVLANLNESVASLSKHMQGCQTLLLITAAVPEQQQQNISAIDAAVAANVQWIVRVSAADARDGTNVPWVTAHAAADRYLRAQADKHRISWTIISPSAFMQNLLPVAPAIQKGFLPQTSWNGKAGWIDTTDVAAVTARVLLDGPKNHHGKTHILTGPSLLSAFEMAQTLSRTIGHRVRYLHLPAPLFGMLLRLSGSDGWQANGLVAQFVEIVRPGLEDIEVSQSAVETITGKQAASFEDWVKRNRGEFEGFDVLPYVSMLSVASLAVGAAVGWKMWMR